MAKDNIVSAATLKELEEKLEYLKTVARREVAEKIKVARDLGDLSENADYDEAKNEQGRIEGEIMELEQMLRTAVVLDEDEISSEVVTAGSHVTVVDEDDFEDEYVIVGSVDADPDQNKISNESPIGAGLLGHRVGDEVEIIIPAGVLKLKIKAIARK